MICPMCGLPLAFTEADTGGPTCNPIRSPECWKFTHRLTKDGPKPIKSDGRADLSLAPGPGSEGESG